MRNLLISLFFFISTFTYADSPSEINNLRIQCDKEKAATLSTLIVPPACQRLSQALAARQQIIVPKDDGELTYEWNGERYCFFNKAREPVSCF